jgi:hypothetical protein
MPKIWTEFKLLAIWSLCVIALFTSGDQIERSYDTPFRPKGPEEVTRKKPELEIAKKPEEEKRKRQEEGAQSSQRKSRLLVLVFLNDDLKNLAQDLHKEVEAYRTELGAARTEGRVFLLDSRGTLVPWPSDAAEVARLAQDASSHYEPQPRLDLGQQFNFAIAAAGKAPNADEIRAVALLWPYTASNLDAAGAFRSHRDSIVAGPDWGSYYVYWLGGVEMQSPPPAWQKWTVPGGNTDRAKWVTLPTIGGRKLEGQLYAITPR